MATSRTKKKSTAAGGQSSAKPKPGAKSSTKSKPKGEAGSTGAGGASRVGRGTRWTEEQVSLLLDTVRGSSTAKEAFETVARQLGKSTGTVQQKYYNLQKQRSGGTTRRRAGRAGTGAGSAGATRTQARASAARGTSGGALPSGSDLRTLTVDELVSLATRVKGEVDRRRQELDAASKLLAG